MAHNFGRSLFGIVGSSKMIAARPSDRSALRSASMVLLAIVSAALLCLPAHAQTSPYVPSMVISSANPVPTTLYPATTATPLTGTQTNLLKPYEVVLDACGNIYTMDHGYDPNGTVTEISPAGGYASTAFVNGNAWSVRLGIDESHANLIVGEAWNPRVDLIPLTGCAPHSSLLKTSGGSGNGTDGWYNPGRNAGDFEGNTYIAVACCDSGYSLYKVIKDTSFGLLSKLPKEVMSIAIDKLDNVYYIMDGTVYELPYQGADPNGIPVYAKVPVKYGTYVNPVGVSMDWAGNLYVADSNSGTIYEIPMEGTTGLNLADQFVVATGLNLNTAVAVNARGDMYYTAAGATQVTGLTLGYANFNAVAVGQSANTVLNFQFNASSTLTGIQLAAGDFTIQPPASGTSACATSTTYGPTATQANCQVTVGFKPSTVGKQSNAVLLTYTTAGPLDASKNPTTITVTASAFVEGIGQGAMVTLDPGTVTPTGSGFKSPTGVVIDHAGNTFVADPANNAVMEFPAGGGAAVSVSIVSGAKGVTPALSAPAAVAVDGAGNVFIADTGNNRVLEVPFVNGALSPAGTTIIASGLKAPASVFVHTNGDLYVADTGNNTILVYSANSAPINAGGVLGTPAKLGVGLLGPLAVTVDGPGNIFIADSGNNQILEYPLGAGQEIVAANILNPSGLATDTSGSLFVVDQGNFRVLRIPSVQGSLSPNDAAEVGLGVANPYGVAIDASSNLYVTDKVNAAAYTIARSQIGLGFGNLAVGVASTALPLTVESAGNLPLVFSAPYFTETGNAADFALTPPTGSSTAACADGLTLPTGTNCALATTFKPTVVGARSATIALAGNAANAPQVTLSGAGVAPSPTSTTLLLIPSVPGAPFYGEPLSVTATVAPTTGTGAPTGVVSFIVDGTQIALLPVVKGVATLPLNSGLTGGAHTLSAVYKGDASNNGSSSAAMPVLIAKAPTTPTLIVTKVQYNNPYSLRHSNTGSCQVTDNTGLILAFYAVPNDTVSFQASVTSPGVGVPSGTLTFYSDGMLINGTPDLKTGINPKTGVKPSTSVTPLLPFAGGTFLGSMSSDANTMELEGLAGTLGENNVLVGPHNITVVYSGDQNYLGSTSVATTMTVTDVSPIANFTGTTANNSKSVTGVSATTGLAVGQFVTGGGVPTGTTIAAIGSDTITLSAVATASGIAESLTASFTPVLLPKTPVGPAPYCNANSPIVGSRPSAPGTFAAAASSTTLTASVGTPATTVLSISSLGGWHGAIDVSCPDLPQYTTCSTNPGQAIINPSTPGQTLLPFRTVLTITTNVPPYVPTATQGGFFWTTSVLLGLLMMASRRRFRKATGGLTLAGIALLLFGGIAGLSGCGSSSSSSPSVVTKPGTYTVHVVLTGAQYETDNGSGGSYQFISGADLPYTMAFTLNVK